MAMLKHKSIYLAGAAVVALGIGACNQAPPEDNSPATPPVSLKKQSAVGGGAPGAPATPPAGSPTRPRTASGGRDPFAAGGAGAPKGVAPAPRALAFAGKRQDPFFVSWKLPVPPPYVFEEVEPIRLAADAVETPHTQPYEVREEPEMRVSGIMTGDGVFAILESPGDEPHVVKPGSTVDVPVQGQTKRTYKVVSITKDKVRLRSQVGNVIYSQEVPLSDVAVGAPARGGGPGAMAPGGPGSFGPGGGFGGSFGGPGGMPSSGPGAGFGPGSSFGGPGRKGRGGGI